MKSKIEVTKNNNSITLLIEYSNFNQVSKNISKLIKIINDYDHHPDVSFDYNTIKIISTTHDANNTITSKDEDLICR